MKRRERSRVSVAILASAVLHGGAVALMWAAASRAEPAPTMRSYAVNIVSPPPRELGAWSPETRGEPDVVEAPPAPAAAEEPAAQPEPPAPAPVEAPKPAAKPAPEPKPVEPPAPIAPPKPKETPKPKEKPAPKPAPAKKEPSPPARPTSKPEAGKAPAARAEASKAEPKEKPASSQSAKAAEPKPGAKTGTRGASPTGTNTGASTGAEPDAASAGGEGLDVRTHGARFADPAYLANIVRQINRYFRRPPGSSSDEVEISFVIQRDGSVAEIQVARGSARYAFRSAAMEAVEQAGLHKAFGPLPKAYPADRLPVSFYFRPAR